MIVIWTRSLKITSIEYLKYELKRIIGKTGGPNSVLKSLISGLDELNIEYKLNKKPQKNDILIVLSGREALIQAIKLKSEQKISKLVAGPNIETKPTNYNNLMCAREIDIILVPSEWSKNFWISSSPEISNKVKVWPAGVSIKNKSTKQGKPIIYNKLRDGLLRQKIFSLLQQNGYDSIIFEYGNFKQKNYFYKLSEAPFVIYLSEVESQGLAIQEAWSYDVPTFINKSTYFKHGDLEWTDDKINAPYLNNNLGDFFNETNDILSLIKKLNTYSPKKECDEHLSNAASAKILLGIINNK